MAESLRLNDFAQQLCPKLLVEIGRFLWEGSVITNKISLTNAHWLFTWKNATEDFHDMTPNFGCRGSVKRLADAI